LSDQLLRAACGMCVGAGVYLACRAIAAGRPSLAADLAALHAPPEPEESPRWAAETGGRLTDLLRRIGLEQALLEDDLAMAGRTAEAHTTARLVHALLGAALGAMAWLAMTFVAPLPLALAAGLALFTGPLGVLAADRPVRRLAKARRQEAQLAVAAYVDLVRILLVGGLPLHAALRNAADVGAGWAFGELRDALAWAKDRGLPPDVGVERLAARVPAPEFADLTLTVTSARRGASPVEALESKAAFVRGAESAQARTESSIADAQMELPAAIVAIAFVAFLTYPMLILLTAGQGVIP
jgi:Flp pilus assembly protein TadB